MGAPYSWDEVNPVYKYHCFEIISEGPFCNTYDRHLGFKAIIQSEHLKNEQFNMAGWY